MPLRPADAGVKGALLGHEDGVSILRVHLQRSRPQAPAPQKSSTVSDHTATSWVREASWENTQDASKLARCWLVAHCAVKFSRAMAVMSHLSDGTKLLALAEAGEQQLIRHLEEALVGHEEFEAVDASGRQGLHVRCHLDSQRWEAFSSQVCAGCTVQGLPLRPP